MKKLKQFTFLALMMCTMVSVAQMSNNGEMNATKSISTDIMLDGQKVPVKIMVYENRNYEMKWDNKDKGKVDRNRTSALAKVTKLISLKSENTKLNEQFIVLRYDRQVTDTFKVSPIGDGFEVTVDDKAVRYIFNEGKYEVDTDDDDFFIVEEFMTK